MYKEFFLGDNLSMTILNSSNFFLECAWKPFVIQSSFWIKIYFDPIVTLRGLGTFNDVHVVYNM